MSCRFLFGLVNAFALTGNCLAALPGGCCKLVKILRYCHVDDEGKKSLVQIVTKSSHFHF